MRALALRTVSLLALAALGSISGTPAARAEDGTDEQFGKVHFQTSCNEVAQRRFDRGMRYQHSFWYRPAKEIFEETLQADPDCAIAYWGIALSLLYNPHFPAPKENLAGGLAALQKAKALGAKSERERDYIDALLAFYSGDEKTTFGQRAQAYLKATEAVAARYPDDDEAQIAYAITLNVTASPNDKTYANQLKGAAILEPIFKRQPRHPGVAHYLIHLYDYPAIAEQGLDAAKRYSEIAPAAPHALHMPSHIFTRVATGTNPSTPIAVPPRLPRRARTPASSCMPTTIWSTPCSSLRRTAAPATSSRIWLRPRAMRRLSAPVPTR